jgi:hypothetical protein
MKMSNGNIDLRSVLRSIVGPSTPLLNARANLKITHNNNNNQHNIEEKQRHHHRRILTAVTEVMAAAAKAVMNRKQALCRHLHRRYITTTSSRSKELVRHYVGRQLYEYYAQPADVVVGRRRDDDSTDRSTPTGNPFPTLLGEWHWKRVFQRLYDTRQGHWLTPVELFQPHYSHILADFCVHHANHSNRNMQFEILEVGCGRGTNARWILSYLREHHHSVYDRLDSYTLVDASPSLHRLQREVLGSGPHAEKVRFARMDLMQVAESKARLLSQSDVPTVVLGLEVLDNLPHDKIWGKTKKKIQQAEILSHKRGTETPNEIFAPLTDPLLQKVIQKVPSYVAPYPTWVPSVACGFLHHILRQRPNVGLVLADFDWLPPPDLPPHNVTLQDRSKYADGEPIVTDMDGRDHECYLTAPSHRCDILFPTDFPKLAAFARRCLSDTQRTTLRVTVEKQADFLQRWGPEHVAKTQSWFGGWTPSQRHNPLLHDFVNCSVLSITFADDD